MKYTRPVSNDFEEIVVLQNKNFVSVLSPVEKEDGYICVSSIEYNKKTRLRP